MMGKGTITAGGSQGLYTVTLELSRERIAAAIAKMTSGIAELEEKITAIEALIDAKEAEITALAAQIAIYEADKEKYQREYCAALEDMVKLIASRDAYVHQKNMAVLQKTALAARIAYLGRATPADPSVAAWCADLTEDLTGSVGTIEVPGERGAVIIQPGHNGNAIYAAARDGQLQPSIAGDPSAVFYNLAMLPGWQKWKPTYRVGVITALDTDADTCSVTLDEALSSAQGLNINQGVSLSNVPITYMTCNASAFAVGDRVVVKFTAQDFSAPTVVGFESNPRGCGWLEPWDDSSPALLCKNHQWTFEYGQEHYRELCPTLPADRTATLGKALLEIANGVLKIDVEANSQFWMPGKIDLDCSGSDAPNLNSMTMRIKSNCIGTGAYGYGFCVYIKDSSGNGQYLAFGGYVNVGIINGVSNDVGLGDGTEKIIDLSIYRPAPGVGFSKGPLQQLTFEAWAGKIGSKGVWNIDFIEIL
jgi:hypothetical protein